MALFRRSPSQPEPPSKAVRRARMLETRELVPWAESCLYQIGRNLSAYARDNGGSEHLIEALQAAETLQILLAEVSARQAEFA